MRRAIILNAALAAGMAIATAPALAASDLGVVTPQQLKEIARAHCIPIPPQATYGVHPGNSWMLDTDVKYSDPPAKKGPCNLYAGETYNILPHGKSWMVDYARK